VGRASRRRVGRSAARTRRATGARRAADGRAGASAGDPREAVQLLLGAGQQPLVDDLVHGSVEIALLALEMLGPELLAERGGEALAHDDGVISVSPKSECSFRLAEPIVSQRSSTMPTFAWTYTGCRAPAWKSEPATNRPAPSSASISNPSWPRVSSRPKVHVPLGAAKCREERLEQAEVAARERSTITSFSWWQCIGRSRASRAHRMHVPPASASTGRPHFYAVREEAVGGPARTGE